MDNYSAVLLELSEDWGLEVSAAWLARDSEFAPAPDSNPHVYPLWRSWGDEDIARITNAR
jgi:hypothetical protein